MTGCKLVRAEPQALFESIKNRFSANVLGGAKVVPESNEWYVVSNEYMATEWFLSISEQMWKERDPRYACCENLSTMAALDGVYPRPAMSARGYVKITGTPGSTLNPTQQIQFGQNIFQVLNPASVPAVIPLSGEVLLQFRCLTPGTVGNALLPNADGALISPPDGVAPVAVVAGSKFCGGREAEACGEFRQRYIARQQFKPRMQFEKLKEAALTWPCATRVYPRGDMCCDPDPPCPKPIYLYVMFDDAFDHGCAPATVCQELTEYLFGSPQGEGRGIVDINVYGEVKPVTPAPIDILFTGLACATLTQQKEVVRRVNQIFANLAPATEVCKNLFLGTVAQVVPDLCDFDITITTPSPLITITACGDIEPNCDVLPYLLTAPRVM